MNVSPYYYYIIYFTGKIAPNPGTNPEFDQALDDMSCLQSELEDYLKTQCRRLQCKVTYKKASGKNRYQIEVPESVKTLPSDYTASSQRKGFRAYKTPDTEKFVKSMEDAENRRDAAQQDTMAIIFREFHRDYPLWARAINFIAEIDVLLAMTDFTRLTSGSGVVCRPNVLPSTEKPYLDLRNARHPCITKTFMSDEFIPNDTQLGCESEDGEMRPRCMLLTGPNMGGMVINQLIMFLIYCLRLYL